MAYANSVCRGSWSLGNNCRVCERCVENDPRKRFPAIMEPTIATQSAEIARLTVLLDVAREALKPFDVPDWALAIMRDDTEDDDCRVIELSIGDSDRPTGSWNYTITINHVSRAKSALAQITPGAEGPQDTAPDRLVKP